MNFIKEFIAPMAVLTIICLVVSGALVFTFQLTDPIIQEGAARAEDAARIEVLKAADAFNKLDVEEMPEGGLEAYQAKNGEGFVIVSQAKGYGGPLKVMTGIDKDGKVAGIKLLESNETPGLGTKVAEASHTSKFIGKDMNLEGIDAIGGATISSNAFLNAAKAAYKVYGEVAGVTIPGDEARDPITLEIMKKLFPEGESFIRLESNTELYKVDELGYIAVTSEQGFIDKVVTAVAMDPDGMIVNILVTEISESEDYGMQIIEENYLSQYRGKNSTDGISAISGSTISSDALKKAVDAALEAYKNDKNASEPVGSVKIKEILTSVDPDAKIEVANVKGAKYAMTNGKATGIVVTADGFAGPIEVIVVVDTEGKIVDVNLGKNSETEDYGTKAAEEAYRANYRGKTSTEGVEAISGATITSDAFKGAVDKALELLKGEGQ